MVFVGFDPFGFYLKDLATGNIVLRSNSTGDLYPFPSTHGASTSSSISTAFSTFSTSIWHSRLGHPRNAILDSLYSSSLIKCNKDSSFVFDSCHLGKHIRLPFINSMSMNTKPFDIIYNDLYGHLLFLVLRDTNTIFFFLITILMFCELFHCFANLKFMIFLWSSSLLSTLNLNFKLNLFNVIMGWIWQYDVSSILC